VVVVGEAFCIAVENKRGRKEKKELEKDTEGTVLELNTEDAAEIAFRLPVSAEGWVSTDQFYRLYPRPCTISGNRTWPIKAKAYDLSCRPSHSFFPHVSCMLMEATQCTDGAGT
jgi:hypothetical protein